MSAPGGPPGPSGPRPPTAIERRKMINALRDRLRPNITDSSLLERYLDSTDWDAEAAYNLWQADRAVILAERGDGSDSSSESDSEDEDEDEEDGEEKGEKEKDGDDASSELSSLTKSVEEEEEGEGESSTLRAMRGNPIGDVLNDNLERERRDAALAIRLYYEGWRADPTSTATTLSPSEAILLLHVNSWDLGQAADSFTSLEDIRLQLSDYDRMRTQLPTAIDPDNADVMREQDERLAEFINITGRSDWWSLRVVLQDHNWNLIEAVSFWFFRGVPPVQPPRKEVRKSTKADPDGKKLQFGIRVTPNERSREWPRARQCEVDSALFMDDDWGVEPDQYVDDPDTNKGKKVKKPRKAEKGREKGAEGFLLTVDGDPDENAQKGCQNPDKFLVEHIAKGKYTFKRFRQEKKFEWPDLQKGQSPRPRSAKSKSAKPQSGRVEFDWNDASHIQLLNNWRRQAIGRTIKGSRQDAGQPWSKEEDDYLITLSEELFQEKSNSSKPPKGNKLIVSTKAKEDWTEKFNEKFTGTIQEGTTEPRTKRTQAAIMQRRTRIQELVDRFGVKRDEKYFLKLKQKADPKQKAGTKRKRADLSDDEDADQSNVATGGEITEDEEEPEDNGSSGGEEAPMDESSGDDPEDDQDDAMDVSESD